MHIINKIIFVFLIVFLSLICLDSFSQKDRNLSVDIGIPQTYKGFFYLYDGIIDLGIGYHINLFNNFYAGGSMRLEYLSRKPELGRSVFYRPSVNLYYTFNIGEKLQLIPWVSGGYSIVQLSNKEFNYKEIQSGVNIAPELKISWRTNSRVQYYIFGRYDYIYLDEDKDFTKLEYYRKVNLTSFGIGIFIKPKQNANPE